MGVVGFSCGGAMQEGVELRAAVAAWVLRELILGLGGLGMDGGRWAGG